MPEEGKSEKPGQSDTGSDGEEGKGLERGQEIVGKVQNNVSCHVIIKRQHYVSIASEAQGLAALCLIFFISCSATSPFRGDKETYCFVSLGVMVQIHSGAVQDAPGSV